MLAALDLPLSADHCNRLTRVSAVTSEPDESFAFGAEAQRFRHQPLPVI
jgi:hypothetical protein